MNLTELSHLVKFIINKNSKRKKKKMNTDKLKKIDYIKKISNSYIKTVLLDELYYLLPNDHERIIKIVIGIMNNTIDRIVNDIE